jgi:predicted S18 family serine protease
MVNKCWKLMATALLTLFVSAASYTALLAPGSGTFTTASATGRYLQIGKFIFVQLTITITTNGTGATNVAATLPFMSASDTGSHHVIPGKAVGLSGKMVQGFIFANSSAVIIHNYDNTYPGASGEVLVVSGWYESI